MARDADDTFDKIYELYKDLGSIDKIISDSRDMLDSVLRKMKSGRIDADTAAEYAYDALLRYGSIRKASRILDDVIVKTSKI